MRLYPTSTLLWPFLLLSLIMVVGVWGVTYVARSEERSTQVCEGVAGQTLTALSVPQGPGPRDTECTTRKRTHHAAPSPPKLKPRGREVRGAFSPCLHPVAVFASEAAPRGYLPRTRRCAVARMAAAPAGPPQDVPCTTPTGTWSSGYALGRTEGAPPSGSVIAIRG